MKFLFSVPGFPLEEVHDPTGAGDSFAGGFMGYFASVGRVRMNAAAGYGVWLGAGEFCGGEIRSRAADQAHSARDSCASK